MKDVVIVGGGIAGLAAAITAARTGARVTLVERARAPGGRATSSTRGEYVFNIGPHALYAPSEAILRELGVTVTGSHPPLAGTIAVRGRERHVLPIGTAAMFSTTLLDDIARHEAIALYARLATLDTAALQDVTIDAWLDDATTSPAVRALFSMLLRVSTYANASEIGSAGAHIDHLRATSAGGVRYIDGGWQSIIDALHMVAVASGVRFLCGTRVTSVVPHGARWCVVAPTMELEADAVILALGPHEASSLLPVSASLARIAERVIPVEAATLDVALSHVPVPFATYGLGVDRPLYFSIHSVAARLAPATGALFHAAMYLPVSWRPSPAAVVEEIEAFVDMIQPGWREYVVHRRMLPHIMVTNAHVTAADGGLPARAAPAISDAPGVYVAGDWVGPTGMLTEAALASGVAAGRLATETSAQGTAFRRAGGRR